MKPKISLLLLTALLFIGKLMAQPSYTVTDLSPVTVNGLEMGYYLKSVEEKEVSDKGTFSRFSIQFYITNTTTEAKIILYKQGWAILNSLSPELVRFDCSNATGARFTNKGATLQASPCNVLAVVEDKDCASNKTVQNKRFVQIGYWIKSGQTITASSVMIVPLNEKPKMTATFLMNNTSSMGSAAFADYPNSNQMNTEGFFKIKNMWKNTYLNIQNGPPVCSEIDNGWWSVQWQLVSVSGTNYFNIQNKWKNTYLSLDPSGEIVITVSHSNTAIWQLEPVPGSNAFRLKNMANGTYLNIENGTLQSTKIWDDAWSARWVFESL